MQTFCANYLEEDEATAFLAYLREARATAEYAAPLLVFEHEEASLQRAEERDRARGLLNLAGNPYLLAALIYLYKYSPTSALPRSNGLLFRALAEALWERERVRRTEGWLPFPTMEAAFARLAFAMIDSGQPRP